MILVFLIPFYYVLLKTAQTANICDYHQKRSPLCCPGWIKNVYGDCVKSECDQDCGDGTCVGLNVCECYDKTVRSEPCPKTHQKLCKNNCSNRGQCVNGKCICESEYSGEDCSTIVISTCYVKIDRGLCKSTPENLQLPKQECCAIFQAAWGNPCVFCHRNSYCPKGYLLQNNQCEDIDECQLKSICLNGECINEKGSFRCICPPDYTLDETTMSCHYQKDQCLIYGSNCGSYGKCVSLPNGQYRCICMKPYKVSADGKLCVKNSMYNVCKLSPKLCLPYGECHPFGYSYVCNCFTGFFQSEDKKSCIVNSNNDYCKRPENYNQCRGGQCISEVNGYRCECYGDYISHNNEQECILRYGTTISIMRTLCLKWEYYSLCQGGECIDTYNDYYCKCPNGFLTTDNGRRCVSHDNINIDQDPCKNPVNYQRCVGGLCVSDGDRYRCECYGEYISGNNGQECVRSLCSRWEYYSLCEGGECIDTQNDYYCRCTNGFYFSESSKRCIRNDSINNDACKRPDISARCRGGQCISEGNDYRCECYGEYISHNNGQECIRYVNTRPIIRSLCSKWEYYSLCQGGECIDTGNDYYCKCSNGFYVTDGGKRCEVIRGITTEEPDNSYCQIKEYYTRCKGGQCVGDKNYGFRCLCLNGFEVSSDGRSCEQMSSTDPCLNNGHLCREGECQRTGSEDYQCICPSYLKLSSDGKSCLIDYRTTQPPRGYCDLESNRRKCATGNCVPDKYYGFKCICKEGYKVSEDGRACYKIEAVLTLCSKHQLQCQGGGCMELDEFNYECYCLDGFLRSEDGMSCIKIEKRTKKSICSKNQKHCQGGACVELSDTNYECQCLKDFIRSEDGKSCMIIGETKVLSLCSRYQPRCMGGRCIQLDEYNYECICLQGFVKSPDGLACTKDYTNNLVSICSKYQIRCQGGNCVDLDESNYECQCLQGFLRSADGKSCVKKEKPTVTSLCSKYHVYCQGGGCKDLGEHNFECQCLNGYYLSQDGRSCIKTREERTVTSLCSTYQVYCQGGGCKDLGGHNYECQCLNGYRLSEDGRSCIKTREELTVTSLCSTYQVYCQGGGCKDLGGHNYECQCLNGYRLSEDGRSCIKTRDVYSRICDKHRKKCHPGICYAIGHYDYMCLCIKGYDQARDKRSCIKRNEISTPQKCDQNRHRCKTGYCFDINDGYLCICMGNYVASDDGRDCLVNNRGGPTQREFMNDIIGDLDPISKNDCQSDGVIEKCEPGVCEQNDNGHYRCLCPYSYKANENDHECVRDSSKCSHCFYGCTNETNTSGCSCPKKYDNLDKTGLCIVKSNSVVYSLASSTCDKESTGGTLVIKFKGLSKVSTESSTTAEKSVSDLLLSMHHKSVRLSFCVPTTKLKRFSHRFIQRQMKVSSDNSLLLLFLNWQIVCVFDC